MTKADFLFYIFLAFIIIIIFSFCKGFEFPMVDKDSRLLWKEFSRRVFFRGITRNP